ncbi:guanine deaminase [Rubrivivax albus]|uniref:Guanine deaminase n=1 Tax=Rubrivivax albus TaxID=2499835 RepID=A0A3S3S9Z1_9BURK|nr:guanine deaminase [Rubrivivax albus]RVT49314.1 guanine deaminase [Rubrivivax albus]
MPVPDRLAIRGDLLDLVAAPALTDATPDGGAAVRFTPDHWLLVERGRIVGRQAHDPGDAWQREDHRGRLVLPGFIDTHVHMPQLDVIASHGADLLDWLDTYTFPAERRYADAEVSRVGAEAFADALLAHGTTAAAVFPTVHAVSADAMAAATHARGMRCITGKVLMDRNAPDGLRDADAASADRELRAGIARWHGTGRQAQAVTVRFAPCSTPQQLALAGRLMAEVPDLYMQTHVAENRDEVRWVAELFPDARSYLDVYHRAGLLGPRAVLAHAIWLDDADRALLAETGSQIAHCPTSNLFLGSGLMDWQALQGAGAAVSLASDVGGGTSLSMVRTMAAAYQVQALQGVKLGAWALLHAATLGAARALRLDHEIGSLEPGCLADVCVWDWATGPVGRRRDALAQTLHERIFAWITLSDERHLVQTWVAGRERHRRDATMPPREEHR